jgi:hypothetical protein
MWKVSSTLSFVTFYVSFFRYSWAGCGLHIEQALAGVKEEDRCKCPRDKCIISRTSSVRMRGDAKSDRL